MRSATTLSVVLLASLVSACDLFASSDTFAGVLAGGGGRTGVLELAIPRGAAKSAGLLPSFALPAPASGGAVAAIHLQSGTVSLSGTFDPATGKLLLAGHDADGDWTLDGTFAADAFTGSYTSPDGPGSFVATHATSGGGALRLYCGTAAGGNGGTWNLIVSADGAAWGLGCGPEHCGELKGTVSGGTVTLGTPDDPALVVTGTDDGTHASGTWHNATESGTWSGSTDTCDELVEASQQGGADAGEVTLPTVPTPVMMNLTNPFDLALDGTHAYTFDDGAIVRCEVTTGVGCAASSIESVTPAQTFPSSLAVANGTVYWTHDFRTVSRCSTSSLPCTPAVFVDVGDQSFPSHLTVFGDHLYWLKEAGSARSVQACPLTGCDPVNGPVTVLDAPPLLEGVPVVGIALGADTLHVMGYFGTLWSFTMAGTTSANAAGTLLVETGNLGSGLARDGNELLYAQPSAKKFRRCTLPACSDSSDVAGYDAASTPVAILRDASFWYLLNRGNQTGNDWDHGTGLLMRVGR